jgi:hypothetical protein
VIYPSQNATEAVGILLVHPRYLYCCSLRFSIALMLLQCYYVPRPRMRCLFVLKSAENNMLLLPAVSPVAASRIQVRFSE